MCFLLQYRRIPPFCYPSSISTETVTLAPTVHLHLFLTFLILFLTLQFLKEITHNVCGKKIKQPTTQTICDDLIITQGPVVTYRSCKHGKRQSHAIAKTEYYTAAESLQLEGFCTLVKFRVPRGRGSCKVFVKSKLNPWPNSTSVTIQKFDNAVFKPLHIYVTAPMREYLRSNNHLSE